MVCLPMPPLRLGYICRPWPDFQSLLLLRRWSCGLSRRTLRRRLLLLRRSGSLPGGLTRLGRRRRLGWILLLGAFADNGRTAGPRNQNCQRERGKHEHNGGGCRGFAQHGTAASRAESGLSAAATKSARPIGAFALLKKHNQNQKDRNNHMKDGENRR